MWEVPQLNYIHLLYILLKKTGLFIPDSDFLMFTCNKISVMELNCCFVTINQVLVRLIEKKKGFTFASEYTGWNLEQWKNVMWSDESRLPCFRVMTTSESNMKYMHPLSIVPTVQASAVL